MPALMRLCLLLCLFTALPATAGDVSKSMVEDLLKRAGVPEEQRKQATEALDIAWEATKGLASGDVTGPATPDPTAPVVGVAVNSPAIASGLAQVQIRGMIQELMQTSLREQRDMTADEAALYDRLWQMQAALDAIEDDAGTTLADLADYVSDWWNSGGKAEAAETRSAFEGWDRSDFDCWQRCEGRWNDYQSIGAGLDRQINQFRARVKAMQGIEERAAAAAAAAAQSAITRMQDPYAAICSDQTWQLYVKYTNDVLESGAEIKGWAQDHDAGYDAIQRCLNEAPCSQQVMQTWRSLYPKTDSHVTATDWAEAADRMRALQQSSQVAVFNCAR